MGDDDIATITRCFGSFDVVDARELDKTADTKSNRGRQSENSKGGISRKPLVVKSLTHMNSVIAALQ